MDWLIFSYSVPTAVRSSVRVMIWRQLQALGAVQPAGAVYVLPDAAGCAQALMPMIGAVQKAGGEALLMRGTRPEGMTDTGLIALFHASRRVAYDGISAAATRLERLTLATKPDARGAKQLAVLLKLRRDYEDATRVDYFECPARAGLDAQLTRLHQLISVNEGATPVTQASMARYRSATWVTPPRPSADALACAWLIRARIDPNGRIRYANTVAPGEIGFDLDGAEFSHIGALCAFERMVFAFRLGSAGIDAIGQIVHDIDFGDGLFGRAETAGVAAMVRGWRTTPRLGDAELEARGRVLFEGLHAALEK